MKKLFLALLVIGMAFQVSAKLKNKHVVGKWKYEVDTGSEKMTGVFNIIDKEGNLTGEIITEDGYNLPFTKIEIREKNTLFFELKTDDNVIKVTVQIEGDTFSGTGSSYDGEAPITGKKVK